MIFRRFIVSLAIRLVLTGLAMAAFVWLLVVPGYHSTMVLAGGALVFLTTMKELPATLLLRPTGFDTLAVDIWSAGNELLFAQAAASALVLLAISAVPMFLLVVRQKDATA